MKLFYLHVKSCPLKDQKTIDFSVELHIHCENSIWNIQIFASNLHELNICEASEIIKLQKNGGSGGIHTQIPNWPIYIGIAA